MLAEAEDIVDTGQDCRENGFAVWGAFHGGFPVCLLFYWQARRKTQPLCLPPGQRVECRRP